MIPTKRRIGLVQRNRTELDVRFVFKDHMTIIYCDVYFNVYYVDETYESKRAF